MGHSTFAPKITRWRELIPKPNYLPHSWTNPTYHPITSYTVSISDQPFCHNALDRQTHTQTD